MSTLKQFIRRILIAFFVVKILTVSVFPVGATNNEYVSSGSFWNWIADHGKFVQSVTGYFPGSGSCPSSEDTYHHASSYQKEGNVDGDIRYWCVCDYCHQSFTAYESDLQQSYEAQVEELQNTIVTSGASLHCYPSSFVNLIRVPSLSAVEQEGKIYSSCGCSVSFPDPYHLVQRTFDSHKHYSYFNLYFQVPVSGNYFISWPENVYSSSNALLYDGSIEKKDYGYLGYPNDQYSGPAMTSKSRYFNSSVLYAFQCRSATLYPTGVWSTDNIFVDLVQD